MRFEDLNEFKNDTKRMNVIRERLSKIIYETKKENRKFPSKIN